MEEEKKQTWTDVTNNNQYQAMDYSEVAKLVQKKQGANLDASIAAKQIAMGGKEKAWNECKTEKDVYKWYRVFMPQFDKTTCRALAAHMTEVKSKIESDPNNPDVQKYLKSNTVKRKDAWDFKSDLRAKGVNISDSDSD